MLQHLEKPYSFYGGAAGVRFAHNVISWYAQVRDGGQSPWGSVKQAVEPEQQYDLVRDFFESEACVA